MSLASYATVCALSALLWRRNWQTDRWFAAFLAFVGQIQGCEVLLWLDQGCRGTNQAASGALLAVIVLEPLAHALIAIACPPAKQHRGAQWALAAASAAFGAALAAVAAPPTADWCSLPCTAPACGRHLHWAWTTHINDAWRLAFFALLAAPVAFMRPVAHAATGAAYAAATFAAAHYLYNTGAAFESMWCWLAVGGYAIPLALCRRPGGRPPRRRAAQRRPARQHAS